MNTKQLTTEELIAYKIQKREEALKLSQEVDALIERLNRILGR